MKNKKVKIYEDYFIDMTDEEKAYKESLYNVGKPKELRNDKSLVVDLFKIDGNKRQVILLKEPIYKDTVIDFSEEEIIDIMKKYSYFKTDVKNGVAVFSQDLASEALISYKLRKEFKKDFSKYYQDDFNKK